MSRRPDNPALDLFQQVGSLADRLVSEYGAANVADVFLAVALAVARDLSDAEQVAFFDLLAGALPRQAPVPAGRA
jgi:enolase